MSAPISHGRGGAANIKPDDTPYTDGEIVREGPIGDQGDGPYSAGRGGAGNIAADGEVAAKVGDDEVVPDVATRAHRVDNYHYGRGGAGNEYLEKAKKEHDGPHESLKDKVKDIFHKSK